MNVEKFKILEKVKLSYLKHRGNVLLVARELNLDVDYVRTLTRKIKKQEERDVSVLIANTLMQQIILGRESRIAYLQESLLALENREQFTISVCCKAPVKIENVAGKDREICLKCHHPCDSTLIDKKSVFELKMQLLRELREEDDKLMDWADKMGYTNKPILPPPEPGPVNRIKQNVIVFGSKDMPEGMKGILVDAAKLPPIAVTRLIKNLEQRMIDVTKEEVEEQDESTG